MTLDKLEVGKDAVIESVGGKGALRRHFLDMGLTPGTEVTMMKKAPMGDPIELRLRSYELTLRLADAAQIEISGIHDTDTVRSRQAHLKDIPHPQVGEMGIYHVRKKGNELREGEPLTFGLIGNQNCGKTTLFNQLTGANQHVGNFPGVTVDRKDGQIKNHPEATVTDLPGIYSLSPYTNEEIVTRDFLIQNKPRGIINIVDATNIERNLYLTMQLIEMDIPMVLALNMMDEVRENGGTIQVNRLEEALGIPVIPISAAKNEGIGELIEHAIHVARYDECPGRLDFCDANGENGQAAIHRCIHAVVHLIEDHAKNAQIPVRFAASKLTEDDSLVLEALNLDEKDKEACEKIISQMENETGMDRQAALADMRFSFIERLCSEFVSKPEETIGQKISAEADKILTGKYTALIAFLGIMALIFYITFGPLGSFLQELMEIGVEKVTAITDSALSAYGLNPVVHSLIINGVFAGVGSVLSFLPLIVVLFFFLSILEDTGYMARVAFVMDKLLRKIGLSGRSFVPMLIGFGCSVPAIMATRTLPSERDRKMTIFLTPFMSCSAKLPIYALFTAAFFSENQVLVILSLYLIGIVVGIIFAYFMKFFVFKGEPVPFVMELPNYRMPSALNVYRLIYTKSKDFVTRAFTIIFWAAIVIWFLQTFDIHLNLVNDSADSLLAVLGNLIVPVFKPLGIDDWRITTAFLTGFMAKESVVSTLTVLLGDVERLPEVFSRLNAFVFLVFSLLYTPCVAAIATVKRELGRSYAVLVVLLQCTIAWCVSFVVYSVGMFLAG